MAIDPSSPITVFDPQNHNNRLYIEVVHGAIHAEFTRADGTPGWEADRLEINPGINDLNTLHKLLDPLSDKNRHALFQELMGPDNHAVFENIILNARLPASISQSTPEMPNSQTSAQPQNLPPTEEHPPSNIQAGINGNYGINPTTGRPFDANHTLGSPKGADGTQSGESVAHHAQTDEEFTHEHMQDTAATQPANSAPGADNKSAATHQKPGLPHRVHHADAKPDVVHAHAAAHPRNNGHDPEGSLSTEALNNLSLHVAGTSAEDIATDVMNMPHGAEERIAFSRARNDSAFENDFHKSMTEKMTSRDTQAHLARNTGALKNENAQQIIRERANGPGVAPDGQITATPLDPPVTTAGRALDGKQETAVTAQQLPPAKHGVVAPGNA